MSKACTSSKPSSLCSKFYQKFVSKPSQSHLWQRIVTNAQPNWCFWSIFPIWSSTNSEYDAPQVWLRLHNPLLMQYSLPNSRPQLDCFHILVILTSQRFCSLTTFASPATSSSAYLVIPPNLKTFSLWPCHNLHKPPSEHHNTLLPRTFPHPAHTSYISYHLQWHTTLLFPTCTRCLRNIQPGQAHSKFVSPLLWSLRTPFHVTKFIDAAHLAGWSTMTSMKSTMYISGFSDYLYLIPALSNAQ